MPETPIQELKRNLNTCFRLYLKAGGRNVGLYKRMRGGMRYRRHYAFVARKKRN